MISVYNLKTKFQGLLRPLVQKLAAKGVTANQVTVSAIILSAVWGLCMAIWPHHHWPWLLLPVVMFVRMALNAVDGMLAREHAMKSRLGAVLNELGDVVADTFLYLPFMFTTNITYLVPLICIFAVVSEMAGVIGVQIGASRRYDGPMGKSDRAFVFGTLGLLMGLNILMSGLLLNIAYAVVLLLLFYTIYNRAKGALKEGAA